MAPAGRVPSSSWSGLELLGVLQHAPYIPVATMSCVPSLVSLAHLFLHCLCTKHSVTLCLHFICVTAAMRPQPGPPEPRIMKAQALYQQKKVEEALR